MKFLVFLLLVVVLTEAIPIQEIRHPGNEDGLILLSRSKRQGVWSGRAQGSGSVFSGKLNYDRPSWGLGGSLQKDFRQPGARAGVDGRYTFFPKKNTDIYIKGGVERNIGPIPAMPNYNVGVGLIHRF